MAIYRDKREILRERETATNSAIELHTEADIGRERESEMQSYMQRQTERHAERHA